MTRSQLPLGGASGNQTVAQIERDDKPRHESSGRRDIWRRWADTTPNKRSPRETSECHQQFLSLRGQEAGYMAST